MSPEQVNLPLTVFHEVAVTTDSWADLSMDSRYYTILFLRSVLWYVGADVHDDRINSVPAHSNYRAVASC